MSPPDRDAPFRRYELVERIAVGGMAEVFKAKSYGLHDFEKVVAIKRILPQLALDPKFERRFVTEAKIAVNLTHANIVQVLDFSRFGESLYIVMEYIDGGDLATLLKLCRDRGQPLPTATALHVAIELLKGLDFAHQKGIVHRDVSPSNVLLSLAGEVKIADFGIAVAADLEATRTFRIVGKWRYMSPEHTRGEILDHRSDLFSAGAVLHELFTGERLFDGADPEAIVTKIRSAPIAAPSSLRDGIPAQLDRPILSLLERDPDRRATAARVRDELVAISYRQTLPATAMALASFLDETGLEGGGWSEDARTESSGRLLEEILESEIGAGATRVTVQALGPPPVHPDDDFGESTSTGHTVIRSAPADDGLTQWSLEAVEPTQTGLIPRPGLAAALADTEPLPSFASESADTEIRELAPQQPTGASPTAPVRPATLEALARRARESRDAWPAEPVAPPVASRPATTPPPVRPRHRLVWAAVLIPAAALVVYAASRVLTSPASAPAQELADARPAAPAADAARAHGLLTIASDPPGARVVIDGSAHPEPTPTRAEVTAQPAEHSVELTLPGREPCLVAGIAVAAGATEPVECSLEAEKLHVEVTSQPAGARVTIDGEPVGDTPISLALDPGRAPVAVHVSLSGYEPATRTIDLAAPLPAPLHFQLRPVERPPQERTGRIDIFAEPWANIYLGDRKVGVAPQKGVRLPVGRHRLKLVNPIQNLTAWLEVTVPSRKPYRVRLRAEK